MKKLKNLSLIVLFAILFASCENSFLNPSVDCVCKYRGIFYGSDWSIRSETTSTETFYDVLPGTCSSYNGREPSTAPSFYDFVTELYDCKEE
mgnify:CR=1 FL=1